MSPLTLILTLRFSTRCPLVVALLRTLLKLSVRSGLPGLLGEPGLCDVGPGALRVLRILLTVFVRATVELLDGTGGGTSDASGTAGMGGTLAPPGTAVAARPNGERGP